MSKKSVTFAVQSKGKAIEGGLFTRQRESRLQHTLFIIKEIYLIFFLKSFAD
jgi:hypothetical protein